MSAFHLIVQGKVQGVFFRATAKKQADLLGVNGWARNTEDGHVEIIAEGEEDKLGKFLEWCKKGPSNAKVEKIIIENVTECQIQGFAIIRG